jgi:hypothetical protein
MSVQHPGTAVTAGCRLPSLAGERLLRVQPDQPTALTPSPHRPIPGREAATLRRRQLQVARRQQRRRRHDPIDRRSPSERLLPY